MHVLVGHGFLADTHVLHRQGILIRGEKNKSYPVIASHPELKDLRQTLNIL